MPIKRAPQGGIFEITVTLTDDDFGTVQSVTMAVVTGGVRLTDDGELQVVGTSERDQIRIEKDKSQIKVSVKLDRSNWEHFWFDETDVNSILIYAFEGNDKIRISQLIDVPATIHAGAGDDLVFGGSGDDYIDGGAGNDRIFGRDGNDIVLGQAGNDTIFGGSGQNLLIGGVGQDWMWGGSGDIVIGGTTDHDSSEAALLAIMEEWTSAESFETRVADIRNGGGLNGENVLDATTVHADAETDHLFSLVGKFDPDWLWADSNDWVLAGPTDLVDIDDT